MSVHLSISFLNLFSLQNFSPIVETLELDIYLDKYKLVPVSQSEENMIHAHYLIFRLCTTDICFKKLTEITNLEKVVLYKPKRKSISIFRTNHYLTLTLLL